MESEFIALDKAGEEAEWLWNFLEDIPYWPTPVEPVCIHCYSQTIIGRAENMMYKGKSRHIRRRHNTVRELFSSGIITIDYVKSKDNVSDLLTKGLSRERVERTSKGMGLRPRTSQQDGIGSSSKARSEGRKSRLGLSSGVGVGSRSDVGVRSRFGSQGWVLGWESRSSFGLRIKVGSQGHIFSQESRSVLELGVQAESRVGVESRL
ncbi:hypothetical protein BC332_31638 [Capsicum chinense]|nr:hypothetical protein BC332_31638 [Capsicum chinense]